MTYRAPFSIRDLGPGILLAATSVGASHLLMSPEAGARFEYGLIWLVLVAHLLKYPAFEFAPRYVAAEGRSLLDAYAEAPGPRHWAIWLGLVDMAIQALGLIASLIGLTATFLMALVGGFQLELWSLLLAVGILALLRWGHYRSLRLVNLILMLTLALGTAIAFLASPPPLTAAMAALQPRIPAGSLLLVGAILGFMPTSVAVSVWQSLWALEQGRFTPQPHDPPTARSARLRRGLLDLRIGYWLSAALAAMFVCLGATLLYPTGRVPEGPEIALTLSRLYTGAFGEWMRPGFLVLALSAMLTTCYTMMDGFPRAFVAALRVLRGRPARSDTHRRSPEERAYWPFLIGVTFGGMALLAAVPDPAFLVKAVGAFGLLLSPIYFALNLWVVRRKISDPSLRPGFGLVLMAWIGIAFMVFTVGLLLWTNFNLT